MSCRLCLRKCYRAISLQGNEGLLTTIKDCTSLNLTSESETSFPREICVDCNEKLDQWKLFKEMCLDSTRKLKNSVTESINFETKHESGQDEGKNIKDFLQTETKSDTICDIYKAAIDSFPSHLDQQETDTISMLDEGNVLLNNQDVKLMNKKHQVPCPICKKVIKVNGMKQHLVIHSDRFRCSQCSGRFNSNASLSQHITTVHSNEKNHICETCGKTYPSKSALMVHIKTHSDQRPYICKMCDYAGRTASALYAHMSTHAQETHICDKCSKVFKSSRNLAEHIRRTHLQDKKLECLECDRKFRDKYKLSVHMRLHTGVKPYKCKVCGKVFTRSDYLKEHVTNVHDKSSQFDCNDCNKRFFSRKNILRHKCILLNR